MKNFTKKIKNLNYVMMLYFGALLTLSSCFNSAYYRFECKKVKKILANTDECKEDECVNNLKLAKLRKNDCNLSKSYFDDIYRIVKSRLNKYRKCSKYNKCKDLKCYYEFKEEYNNICNSILQDENYNRITDKMYNLKVKFKSINKTCVQITTNIISSHVLDKEKIVKNYKLWSRNCKDYTSSKNYALIELRKLLIDKKQINKTISKKSLYKSGSEVVEKPYLNNLTKYGNYYLLGKNNLNTLEKLFSCDDKNCEFIKFQKIRKNKYEIGYIRMEITNYKIATKVKRIKLYKELFDTQDYKDLHKVLSKLFEFYHKDSFLKNKKIKNKITSVYEKELMNRINNKRSIEDFVNHNDIYKNFLVKAVQKNAEVINESNKKWIKDLECDQKLLEMEKRIPEFIEANYKGQNTYVGKMIFKNIRVSLDKLSNRLNLLNKMDEKIQQKLPKSCIILNQKHAYQVFDKLLEKKKHKENAFKKIKMLNNDFIKKVVDANKCFYHPIPQCEINLKVLIKKGKELNFNEKQKKVKFFIYAKKKIDEIIGKQLKEHLKKSYNCKKIKIVKGTSAGCVDSKGRYNGMYLEPKKKKDKVKVGVLGNYKKGKKHGEWKYYWSRYDNLKEVKTYKNGKIDGSYKVYYPSGKLREKGKYRTYKNKVYKYGRVYTYYENKKLKAKLKYKRCYKYVHSFRRNIVHGCLNGYNYTYYRNGKLKAKVKFKKGNPVNAYIKYRNGSTLLQCSRAIFNDGGYGHTTNLKADLDCKMYSGSSRRNRSRYDIKGTYFSKNYYRSINPYILKVARMKFKKYYGIVKKKSKYETFVYKNEQNYRSDYCWYKKENCSYYIKKRIRKRAGNILVSLISVIDKQFLINNIN